MNAAPKRSFSSWRKGGLLGLILVLSLLYAFDTTSTDCALDSLDTFNYLSLQAGGFSLFIRWPGSGCQ